MQVLVALTIAKDIHHRKCFHTKERLQGYKMKNPRFRVWDSTTMDVENLNIMLGTQVFDKQNNEIFEYDLLYYKYEDNSERGECRDKTKEEYSIVIFENGAFLRKLSDYVKEPLFINTSHWTVKEFKIIGNIYEFPREYLTQFDNQIKELHKERN